MRRFPLQVVAGVTATLAYLTSGMFTAWNAPVIPRLQQNTSHLVLTEDETSWIASVGPLVAVAPSFFTGPLMDALGRRRILLLSAVPFFTASLWQRFATTFGELLATIVISGFGIGIVIPVSPTYLVEIAEDRIRGFMVSMCMVMMGLGGVLISCVAPYVSFFTLCEFMLAFPVLFVAAFWWMPESPYFLVTRGRLEEASEALMRLRGRDSAKDVLPELEQIRRSVEARADHRGSGAGDAARELLRSGAARRALLVAIVYSGLTILCGSGAMGVNATQIFLWSGSSLDSDVCTIILTSIQTLVSVVASLAVDRLGRRPLLLFSFSLASVSVTAEGVYFYLKVYGAQEVVDTLDWLPLTALICFYVTFYVGANSLTWTVVNEVVPSSIRGLANSVVAIWTALLTFASIKLFQVVSSSSLGKHTPFWFFGACALMAFFFTWFFIPETKGRALDDIQAEMTATSEERKTSVSAKAQKNVV